MRNLSTKHYDLMQVDIYENPSEHYGFMPPPSSSAAAGSAEDILKPVYYMEEEGGGPLLKVGFGECFYA